MNFEAFLLKTTTFGAGTRTARTKIAGELISVTDNNVNAINVFIILKI